MHTTTYAQDTCSASACAAALLLLCTSALHRCASGQAAPGGGGDGNDWAAAGTELLDDCLLLSCSSSRRAAAAPALRALSLHCVWLQLVQLPQAVAMAGGEVAAAGVRQHPTPQLGVEAADGDVMSPGERRELLAWTLCNAACDPLAAIRCVHECGVETEAGAAAWPGSYPPYQQAAGGFGA